MSSFSSALSVLTQGLGAGFTPASVLTQGYPRTLKPPVAQNTTAIPTVAEGQPVLPGNLRMDQVSPSCRTNYPSRAGGSDQDRR
jgi:hypothetical protein